MKKKKKKKKKKKEKKKGEHEQNILQYQVLYNTIQIVQKQL